MDSSSRKRTNKSNKQEQLLYAKDNIFLNFDAIKSRLGWSNSIKFEHIPAPSENFSIPPSSMIGRYPSRAHRLDWYLQNSELIVLVNIVIKKSIRLSSYHLLLRWFFVILADPLVCWMLMPNKGLMGSVHWKPLLDSCIMRWI